MPTCGGRRSSGSSAGGCWAIPPCSRPCADAPRTPIPRSAARRSSSRCTRASGCSRPCGRVDPELQRQLAELEGTATAEEATPPAKAKKGKPAKAPAREESLEDADFEPLLQATASRALDTCLRGARGLAVLGDPRAFGLLLQLSREGDKAARAEVCRAMAALDDPRSIERLRSLLHDKEVEVRDAAFTALAHIHKADPLLAAESGLNASHEDVRRRGLQVLIAEVRKAPPKRPDDALLAAPGPRPQRQLPRGPRRGVQVGARPATGRRRGRHAPLRAAERPRRRPPRGADRGDGAGRRALGLGGLLLEFFNDPDPKLRDEAFAFAIKKTKGLEFLEAGLGSRHADLRKRSVDELIKKHTAAAQALLVRALDDEDRDVRLAALESLVDADALPTLAGGPGQPPPRRPRPRRQGPRPARRPEGPRSAARPGDGPGADRARAPGRLARARRIGAGGPRRAGRPRRAAGPDPAAGQPARRRSASRRRGPWSGRRGPTRSTRSGWRSSTTTRR